MLFPSYYDLFDVVDSFNMEKYIRNQHTGIRSTVENEQLTLSVDLPGVKKEDIDITFSEDGIVKIACKRYDFKQDITQKYSIGKNWDTSTVEAKLEHGVLTIKLQKLEKSKPFKVLVK